MQRTTALDKGQVTAVEFLDERVILPGIVDQSNEGQFLDLMVHGNRYTKTDMPRYHNFVDENLHKVCVIDSVTGSGSTSLTVTLTADGGSGVVRRDDVLLFNDGKVGKISSAITTASSKDTFTVTSVDGTNLTAAGNDKMTNLGPTVGQGSSKVSNITYTVTKEYNQVQKFREYDAITDVQNASIVTVTINGSKNFAFYQTIQKAKAFKGRIASTMIGGRISTNEFGTTSPTLTDANGNSVQTTGGLYQQTTTKGVLPTVGTLGAFDITDLDNECDTLNAVKAPADYLKLCPDPAQRAISRFGKGLNSSGITSARLTFGPNDPGKFDFTVEQFKHGRYNFEIGALDILNHPEQFAYTGASPVGKGNYLIPKGNVNTVGNGTQPRIQIRYMDHGYGSNGTPIIAEWYTGMGQNPTNDVAVKECHWLTTQGLQTLGTKQFGFQEAIA